MSVPEQMTQYEFAELRATAMIELEDFGHMRAATKEKLIAVRDGKIELMEEGWVRPLDDKP